METSTFAPPRRLGAILLAVIILAQAAGGALCLWQAAARAAGLVFVLFILAALLLLGTLPFVVYRFYALLQGRYEMDRDRLRIHWGLRGEDIPLPEIEWVRPADELGYPLPLPIFAVPGAYLGLRSVSGLGQVEFIASSRRRMLLVATPQRVYVISPADRSGFMRAFQQAAEMGSLMPAASQSIQPTAFFRKVWQDLPARVILVVGLIAALCLFILVGLVIPSHAAVPLGFDPHGQPLEAVPAERLLLLPVLGALVYAANLTFGLFFYRRPEQRPASLVLWIGSILTSLLLIIAVIILVSVG